MTFITHTANKVEQALGEIFRNNGFMQCVTHATRGASLLDIVCTNEPLTLCSIDVLPPFALSDHNSIAFQVSLPCINNNSLTDNCSGNDYRYLWSRADYASIAIYLSRMRWDDLFTVNFTADDMWNAFRSIFNEAIELYVRCQRESGSLKPKNTRA